MLVRQEGAVHEGELSPDQLGEVRMQPEIALLGVQEHAHEAARLVPEDAGAGGVDFAVDELEPVNRLGGSLPARRQQRAQREPGQPPFRRGQQGHALLEGAGDEEDIAHVEIHIAHELLDPAAGGAFPVAQVIGHSRLQVFAEHIHRAVRVVMHLGAHPQQKIVSGLELPALLLAEKLPRDQILQRPRPVFEESHPDQVLEIAQPAAAVLEIGLLHRGGVAKLGPPGGLVLKPRGDIFLPVIRDALGLQGLFEFPEQFFVPVIRRASISEVFDCMSLLATLTQSSMLRTECPTLSPRSQRG